MDCRKCSNLLPDGAIFCPWCGTRQEIIRTKTRRSNGQGTIIRRGKTYSIRVVLGYRTEENGHIVTLYREKGGFATKAAALAAAPALKAMKQTVQDSTTWITLYNKWAEEYSERITHSTFLCYQGANKYFSSLHGSQFTKIHVADLQHCIDQCPNGKRTKENMKALASLLYKYALSHEIVDRNRAETLYTGNDKTTTRPPITMEELRLIAASGDPYADYIICLCYLGFRPGELLALKKTDYRNGTLTGGSKTKAGRDRPVPVSPVIRPILDMRASADSDYLFPRLDTMKRMTDSYFREKCWDPLMKSLGITGKVPYSCRHTFSNLIKKATGSNTDKAALMGHTKVEMTEYYQTADLESLTEITNQLADFREKSCT